MKISLITACRNSAATLRTALASAAAQRGVDLEHIVVDGASSDGSVGIIREFAEAAGAHAGGGLGFRWVSERDGGMYDAINKGVLMATGDVVGILNADDLMETPDSLAHVAAAFSDDVDAVYADVRFVKDDLETTVRYYGARRWRPWMLRWGYMPPHPGVYVRREAFGRLGLYKTDYNIAADYDLLIRFLRKARLRTRYLGESLVRMRMGGRSTRGWESFFTLNREIVRCNRENGYFCSFPMMLPKYAFKVFEFALPALGIGNARARGAGKGKR